MQQATVTSATSPKLLSGAKGRQTALAALGEAIQVGELMPAQRLIEHKLADRYSVTRSSIRAALLELEARGLVERIPNRGSRVRVIPIEEAIGIIDVRMALEGLCAARAATRATPADIDALYRLTESMEQAVTRQDPAGYSQLNSQLHSSIVDLGDHRVARDLLGQLNAQLIRHRFRMAQQNPRRTESLEEHLRIVGAIAAHKPNRARKAMEAHLKVVVDVLKERAANFGPDHHENQYLSGHTGIVRIQPRSTNPGT